MTKVLITGATGFVGRAVLRRMHGDGFTVTAASRREAFDLPKHVTRCVISGLCSDTDWSAALCGQDVVVHCAARVHVMQEFETDPLDAFRSVNVHGTINLARQAVVAGIRRFLFISSIGVNGAQTLNAPFTAADEPQPHSPYASSKYEAEIELNKLSMETGLEVVIIRPPLVYGLDAPGNFGALIRWLLRGVPLPLGSIENRRSYVALDNLVDLVVTCSRHPAAAGQIFMVSDGEDVSTTQLLHRTAHVMGKPAWLIPVPAGLLQLGATLLGKRDVAQRLCGSLQVDISKTRQVLGWSPPLTLDQGLKKAVEGLKL